MSLFSGLASYVPHAGVTETALFSLLALVTAVAGRVSRPKRVPVPVRVRRRR